VHGDDLPLGVGQVTGIAPGLLRGPAHTLGMRGPCCLFGLHTSREHRARVRASQHTRHGTSLAPPRDHGAIGSFIKHSLSLPFNLRMPGL
jgi:hypothetical protein